jgi:hypothetical protein
MLHDGRQRHAERFRQLADRQALLALQAREQRPPGRVGEGGERAVEQGVLMVYHLVKFKGVP